MKFRLWIATVLVWLVSSCVWGQAVSAHPQTYGTTAVSTIEIPAVAFDSSLPVSFPFVQSVGSFSRYTPGCGGDA